MGEMMKLRYWSLAITSGWILGQFMGVLIRFIGKMIK